MKNGLTKILIILLLLFSGIESVTQENKIEDETRIPGDKFYKIENNQLIIVDRLSGDKETKEKIDTITPTLSAAIGAVGGIILGIHAGMAFDALILGYCAPGEGAQLGMMLGPIVGMGVAQMIEGATGTSEKASIIAGERLGGLAGGLMGLGIGEEIYNSWMKEKYPGATFVRRDEDQHERGNETILPMDVVKDGKVLYTFNYFDCHEKHTHENVMGQKGRIAVDVGIGGVTALIGAKIGGKVGRVGNKLGVALAKNMYPKTYLKLVQEQQKKKNNG